MSVMYTHRHAIKSNGCGTSRSRSNSPMLFSDGEGPAGLRDYDPSGKRPPSDWETGDYHPYNKFIQRCNEKLRERLVKLGCTQYKDGDEINFIFWRPVWRLHRNYDGDLRLCIFNYQTLEESRSMGDKHSWGALNGSGVLISKTPRTTRDLLSPELYETTVCGDVHAAPFPSFDPRGGSDEEPDNAKMAAYKEKQGASWRPNQGVMTRAQQKIVLESTFSLLIRPVLEEFKDDVKLVVPMSALPVFLEGMGYSTRDEFDEDFPGVLAGVPGHSCVLYNKLFSANPNFNTTCRNIANEWTKVRVAFSGDENYPPCDLDRMLHDENSRLEMQRESSSLGGTNCGVEYARLRDLGDERDEADDKKYASMRSGRANGGEKASKKIGEASRGKKKTLGVEWSTEVRSLLSDFLCLLSNPLSLLFPRRTTS